MKARLLLDGEQIGTLRLGESFTADVPPGVHIVRARMRPYTTPPLAIAFHPGRVVRLTLRSYTRGQMFINMSAARFWLEVPLIEAHDYPPHLPPPEDIEGW